MASTLESADRLGDDNLSALARNMYGVLLYHSGKIDQSVVVLEDAAALLSNQTSPEYTTILNNLGPGYVNKKDQRAFETYQQAMSIRIKLLGEDHLDTGVVSFNLGQLQCLLRAGHYESALEFH
jgi:tetratricopeptide (TPR) repeat protein